MIDWIKITLRDFTGKLDLCSRGEDKPDHKTGLIYENYTLPNDQKYTKQHSMKVSRQVGSSVVTVKGSIRKWHTHRDTLADLTAKSFERTMKKLAKRLNIPFEELCSARFTQCEIGLNIKTSIPCREIIPMAVRYGGLKKTVWKTTVYFKGQVKELKIYDKGEAIGDLAKGAENIRTMKRMFYLLEKSEFSYLRIEYTLFSQKSFNQHQLGHIKKIADLITYYSDLYKFWCRETNRIVLFNDKIRHDKSQLKKAEYRIAMDLALHGFEKAIERNESGIKKDARSASQMRSRALKKLLAVVNKHYPGQYTTSTLRIDVARNLYRKHTLLGSQVPIGACYKALWGLAR